MLKKVLLSLILSVVTLSAMASDNNEPLSMDQAFRFSATAKDDETLIARFEIHPGYYLYKERIHFKLQHPEQGRISPAMFPIGMKKDIEDLGVYEVFSKTAIIGIPFKPDEHTDKVQLLATYQGCSEDGYCYPPITKLVSVDIKSNLGTYVSGETIDDYDANPMPDDEDEDEITSLLEKQKLFTILLSFFGFGLLLSFTPCVLPMIPILSGIIVGHKDKLHTRKAFFLSLSYVLSMSLTYAVAGLVAGYIGGSVQALLQQPWILLLSSLVFVALAFSLFGYYEISLPQRWQNKLTGISNQQKRGSYVSAAIMGCLATLIISPCVTPALVGALGYIGQTGDATLGGLALFTLGLGSGVPLLIIGTAGGKVLPKAGAWMNSIRNVLGVMMLGMAIWILSRVLPGQVVMILWAALLVISSVFLGIFKSEMKNNLQRIWKGVATMALFYGCLLLVGAAMGNEDPLKPLYGFHYAQTDLLKFTAVENVDDVQRQVTSSPKLTMLDFYADWCVSCQIMEKQTFSNPKVQAMLHNFKLLKANVTRNDKMNKSLQNHYGVIAPPTILFFDENGKEMKSMRIVGEKPPEEFLAHLVKMIKAC